MQIRPLFAIFKGLIVNGGIIRQDMDRSTAKQRIDFLKQLLEEGSRRYYVENAPTMSDFEYDRHMHELEALEAAFPEFAAEDSPTRHVGSDLEDSARSEFVRRSHRYPMLSLGNTYSIAEIEEFVNRAQKLTDEKFTYCCELKFDGTAICLTYSGGKLVRALTRGDGTEGDDVTANVRHIANIPSVLSGSGWPDEFEIRGEILMPFSSFEALNAQKKSLGEAPFANPRNAAAGSLKQLDPAETGRRGLECTLYHIPGDVTAYGTHYEALRAASSWGLPVSEHMKVCRDITGIEDYITHWDVARKGLPVATDGIVIKINEFAVQKALGYTAKFPRWAVAFKFQAERVLTRLLSVDFQVGRTGAVTPVANLDPVLLSGTIVKRATLNNAGQMDLLDICDGDSVYVEKGGEIIPKITGVELSARPEGAGRPAFPERCPECGTPLVREDARYYCPNTSSCPAQIKERLTHFLSRKAMNVLAGDATVSQLHDLGLVNQPSDFYKLKARDLVRLDGWQDRAAARFLESLSQSRNVPFYRVVFAIGIRHVGETTAKALAARFPSIDSLMAAKREELLEVQDVGDVIADSVLDFFSREENRSEMEELRKAGLQMASDGAGQVSSNALSGKTIVISGNFSISRDAMKALVESNGGKNSSSVSSKTSFLLAGDKPGPEKVKRAQELGVTIIGEQEFMAMLPKSSVMDEEEEPSLFEGF